MFKNYLGMLVLFLVSFGCSQTNKVSMYACVHTVVCTNHKFMSWLQPNVCRKYAEMFTTSSS